MQSKFAKCRAGEVSLQNLIPTVMYDGETAAALQGHIVLKYVLPQLKIMKTLCSKECALEEKYSCYSRLARLGFCWHFCTGDSGAAILLIANIDSEKCKKLGPDLILLSTSLARNVSSLPLLLTHTFLLSPAASGRRSQRLDRGPRCRASARPGPPAEGATPQLHNNAAKVLLAR